MTGSERYSSREVLLGLLAVLCLGGLCAVLLKYVEAGSYWRRRQEIFVVFANVGTLTQDSPVRYNGLEKGRVKSLRPVHLDEKTLREKFRPFTPRDLEKLPIRGDDPVAIDKKQTELLSHHDPVEFNEKCREELLGKDQLGATMIELCLEVLDEDDPIQYHQDDDVRIVISIFGDAAVEIVAGGGPVIDASKPRYILGTSGDFIDNLTNSMGEVKKILGAVKETIGEQERKSFGRAQARYTPVVQKMTELAKTSNARMAVTIKRYGDLTVNAKEQLNKTGIALESLIPAAEAATQKIQAALKGIETQTLAAKAEATDATNEISQEIVDAREMLKGPIEEIGKGLDFASTGLQSAKAAVERVPARLDTMDDILGSMQSQSTDDMNRAAVAGKKSVANLKITAFIAKEHKDWMLGNRDAGEYLAQTALDIRRRLATISRRMTNVGADLAEALRSIENDPAVEPVVDPVRGRTDRTLKNIREAREPYDAILIKIDELMYPPWRQRKRAAWAGDGLIRGPDGGR